MYFDTGGWGWPQWIILFLLILSLAINANFHGKPRVHTSGPKAGEPYTYDIWMALIRFGFWGFLLIAGGFFK